MDHHLHSGYSGPVLRSWQCGGKNKLTPDNLMWPVFLVEDPEGREEIPSLPGVYRMGVNVLMQAVQQLVPHGLKSVLLFAVTNLPKVSLLYYTVQQKLISRGFLVTHIFRFSTENSLFLIFW